MDILGSLKGKCLLFYEAQSIWFCCAWYKFCLIFLMRLGDNTNQRSLNTHNTDSFFSSNQEMMSNNLLYVVCTPTQEYHHPPWGHLRHKSSLATMESSLQGTQVQQHWVWKSKSRFILTQNRKMSSFIFSHSFPAFLTSKFLIFPMGQGLLQTDSGIFELLFPTFHLAISNSKYSSWVLKHSNP